MRYVFVTLFILPLVLGTMIFPAHSAKFPYVVSWVKTEGVGTVTLELTIKNGNDVTRCTKTWTVADSTPVKLIFDRIGQETSSCMMGDFVAEDIPASGSMSFTPQDLLFAPSIVPLE